jgi:hypothetical protein
MRSGQRRICAASFRRHALDCIYQANAARTKLGNSTASVLNHLAWLTKSSTNITSRPGKRDRRREEGVLCVWSCDGNMAPAVAWQRCDRGMHAIVTTCVTPRRAKSTVQIFLQECAGEGQEHHGDVMSSRRRWAGIQAPKLSQIATSKGRQGQWPARGVIWKQERRHAGMTASPSHSHDRLDKVA